MAIIQVVRCFPKVLNGRNYRGELSTSWKAKSSKDESRVELEENFQAKPSALSPVDDNTELVEERRN